MTPANIVGNYDPSLVALSILIAVCASYAALELAGCMSIPDRRTRLICRGGGAVSMGTGIWAMHYVGMLAFQLPIVVLYNLPIVGVSLLAAIVSAAVALHVVGRENFGPRHLLAGSLAMGSAIFAMHYIGMAAMRMPAQCHYNLSIVFASFVVAVLVSSAALWITHKLRGDVGRFRWLRIASATLMGFAIAAMHYTGMAAAYFQMGPPYAPAGDDVSISPFAVEEICVVVFAILLLGVLGVLTTRFMARQADLLHSSRQEYRLLLEHNLTGVCRTSMDGRVLDANQMLLQILGYERREDLLGRDVTEHYWYPEDRGRILRLLQENGAVKGQEVRMKRRDGHPIWIIYNLALSVNPETKEQEVITTAIDVSALKQTLDDLQQAKDAAESANRAKSQFVANMSHELRTPLHGILGMTTLALYCDVSPEVRCYLQDAEMSARALLGVINDVLDFSKIDAGQMTLVLRPFSPRQLLELAVRTIASTAQLKGITLSLVTESELPEIVVGDDGRFRQILINLLGNAVKFTEQGGVTLYAASGPQSGNTAGFVIRIVDTGIGIPPDKLETIFEEFAQADASDTRRFGGTGLGLAISSRLLTQMGGRIWVESVYGQGSTFHLTVPFQLSPSPNPSADNEFTPVPLRLA